MVENIETHAAPAIEGEGARLVELPHVGKVILRGSDSEITGAVRGALELELPMAANTSIETRPVSALWLGPDEWMLTCAPGSEDAVAESLRAALAGAHAAVVDVSDARAVFRLSGGAARTVLAKGCALDLHPRAFALGDVAQTRLAKADVVVHQTIDEDDNDGPIFDIYVARSFADYLWRWLADAMA
jgi:sarcosine oxidase subunit gamma